MKLRTENKIVPEIKDTHAKIRHYNIYIRRIKNDKIQHQILWKYD